MILGNSAWAAGMIACCAVAGVSTFKVLGPEVERRYVTEPVHSLTFDEFECRGADVLVSGVLDKSFWPDGEEAEFLGLNLMSDEAIQRRLPWRRANPNDRSPQSRVGGVQVIDLYIEGGCGVPFFAHTRHASPWTGLVMSMRFGPFQTAED